MWPSGLMYKASAFFELSMMNDVKINIESKLEIAKNQLNVGALLSDENLFRELRKTTRFTVSILLSLFDIVYWLANSLN